MNLYRIQTTFCRTYRTTAPNPHEAFSKLEHAALVTGRRSLEPFINFRRNAGSQDFDWGRRYFSRDGKHTIDVELIN